jgi:7-cyano-7-deazaguanine synthase
MGLAAPLPVETPLSGLTKAEVVRRAAGLPIELTFSCLNPTVDHRHCGACNKCAERRKGFVDANVPDPTAYAYGSRAGAGST